MRKAIKSQKDKKHIKILMVMKFLRKRSLMKKEIKQRSKEKFILMVMVMKW